MHAPKESGGSKPLTKVYYISILHYIYMEKSRLEVQDRGQEYIVKRCVCNHLKATFVYFVCCIVCA